MTISQWLPKGYHWGLRISHFPVADIGPLIASAGDKLIWHTTEGSYSSALGKFRGNSDVPHVLISPASGQVVQFLPLNMCASALEHPSGTPETNRAGCRQVEIAGKAAEAGGWPTSYYARLASLAVLIEHRSGIRRANYHPFKVGARRLTPSGFPRAVGHLGHQHVPNNSHWDPGAFRVATLFQQMALAEKRYQ